jgi:hypothetical protein
MILTCESELAMSVAESVRNETLGFQQEIARLQALLEASRRVHGALELDEVLHCVLEISVKELEAEGAFFTDGEAIAAATAPECAKRYRQRLQTSLNILSLWRRD